MSRIQLHKTAGILRLSSGEGRSGRFWSRRARWTARFATVVVAVSGGVLVAAPALAVVANNPPYIAFRGSNGDLWEACSSTITECITGPAGINPVDTGLAIAAGTSPAIAYYSGDRGNYEAVFQGSNGHLWITGPFAGTEDLGLSMMPGTSPAIAYLEANDQGYAIAFQSSAGDLVTTTLSAAGTPSTTYWDLPMDPGSSPTITEEDAVSSTAAVPSYEVAFNNSVGSLALAGTFANGSLSLPMAAGTSPSIIADGPGSGSYEIAYHGSNGDLLTAGTITGLSDTGMAMAARTSPSIAFFAPGSAALDSYEVAFQGSNGHLWTTGNLASVTSGDTGQLMAAGTSPAVKGTFHVVGGDYGYDASYQTPAGGLSYYDSLAGQAVSTGASMDNSTSPADGGGDEVAYVADGEAADSGCLGIDWHPTQFYTAGQVFTNCKGTLQMQSDGNFVLYDENGQPLWATNTAGNPGAETVWQSDGNLVVYTAAGTPIWASNTAGLAPGGYFDYQTDGNLVIYNAVGQPVWASNTVHP